MAEEADIKQAIGCLSASFPAYTAKQLAALTDSIVSAVQGFTDPLAAISDLNLDNLIDQVAEISEGDVFGNLASAAAGLLTQHVTRELEDAIAAKETEVLSASKRVNQIRNMSSKVVGVAQTMMSLYNDMPYAAVERMCQQIIRLDVLKIDNLKCLRKHIVQLVNCVLVLVENVENYKDDTIEDLIKASAELEKVKAELIKSRVLVDGTTTFDSTAFERARTAMVEVARILTPDKNGTTILDVALILTSGSVEAGQVDASNRALATLVIPSLINLIEAEVAAVVSQIGVINYYIGAMQLVIESFRGAATTPRISEQRNRAISDIYARVENMSDRINLTIANESITVASGSMLLWASRAKAIIVLMDNVKKLAFEEGSVDGEVAAAALASAFEGLLEDLMNISNANTVDGIEDPTDFRDRVLALTAGARRILSDLEKGRATANRMATFHALSVATATAQVSTLENSSTVASLQKVACEKYVSTYESLDLQIASKYADLTDSMRQLGLDRAVDLLNAGQFEEFVSADLNDLSYLGQIIQCLTRSLDGIDDAQTRQQIIDIRDDLVGLRTNLDVAGADSADQGRARFIGRIQEDIASTQRNAEIVKSIVNELTVLANEIGADLSDVTEGITGFLGNLDQLAVAAGGRLSGELERFSGFPNAGVPFCEPT